MIQNVSAASYFVERKSLHDYKLITSAVSKPVYLNLYEATIDGIAAETYCVDPGKRYGQKGYYRLLRDIDPTTNLAVDLAIAGALQEINNYRSQGVGGDTIKLVGDIAMRWIFMTYGGSSLSDHAGDELENAYTAFRSPENAISVNGNDTIVSYAKQVFAAAQKAAEAGSYDNAVAQGYIYSPELKAVEYRTVAITGNSRTVQFIIQPKDTTSSPSKWYLENFQAGCTNTTVTCTIDRSKSKYEPAGYLITMNINTANWNNQDLGIYVDPAYCDSRDATSQILLLGKDNDSTQRMLAVLPGTCPATPTTTGHRKRIYLSSDTCECDYTSGTTWNGDYIVTKYKNGNVVGTEKFKQTETDKVNQYSCPSADTCKNRNNFTCQKPSESKDGNYHCPNPSDNNINGICSPDEYKAQCTHNCDPDGESDEPDDAKHNSTPSDQFYCKESSPGAGDGKNCSVDEHNASCHKNYVDCKAVVSLPGTCTDIQGNGTADEGTISGVISDINEGDAKCANISTKTNQIKKCVLGKKDATNTSYEATNEISENSYCKVYCKEKYNFVLPNARLTTSGGYFKLSTTVTGTRDCYVAGADNSQAPIDETKFNKDLEAAQRELIDAWNEYNRWKTAVATGVQEGSSTSPQHCIKDCDCDSDEDSDCEPEMHVCTNKTYTRAAFNYTCYDRNTGEEKQCSEPLYYDKACTSHNCPNGQSPETDEKNKRDNALKTLQQKAKALNDIIAMYNSCTGAISNTNYSSDLTSATTSSTTQSTWNNDMIFNPKVEFKYDKSYNNGLWTDFDKEISSSSTSNNSYCTGNINDSYECTTATTSSIPTKDMPIITCTKEKCSTTSSFKISTAKWITKSKTQSKTYQTSQNFSTYTPYGTVVVEGKNSILYTKLPEGSLPIQMITKTGVFSFEFRFSNIGQSNSSTELGRLANANKSSGKSVIESNNVTKCNDEHEASTNGGYVCHYLNNCTDNCDFKCETPDSCTFNTCDNGKCVVTCTNCIFDGNKTTYGYRTVSLNKLFPNGVSGRGYNWSGEGIENQKATDTRKEIEESGESIYESPQYSYTLTPSNMKNIRDYNDKVKSFTNERLADNSTPSLQCETVTYGETSYNVNCRSGFLNLIETSGKKYATVNERVTKDQDAFILYTSTSNCLDGSCLKKGVGPSWKLKGSSKE